MVFYVVDATAPAPSPFEIPWDKTVVLLNKCDLDASVGPTFTSALACWSVSARTGTGLDQVRSWLRKHLTTEVGEDSVLVSNARHFEQLGIVRRSIDAGLPLIRAGESPDLIALELQTAVRAVFEILGVAFDDQVMDRVFSEFCLGK